MLSSIRHLVETELNMNQFGCFDAPAQKRDQAVLFLDCFEQFAQLLLIGKLNGRGNLRRAFDVDFSFRVVAKNSRVAQEKCVTGKAAVLLAVAFDLNAKIGEHRFEGPANIVTVEIGGNLIEILL